MSMGIKKYCYIALYFVNHYLSGMKISKTFRGPSILVLVVVFEYRSKGVDDVSHKSIDQFC